MASLMTLGTKMLIFHFFTIYNCSLAGDACFRPLITIRHHDLHEGNIRADVSELVSYHKRD